MENIAIIFRESWQWQHPRTLFCMAWLAYPIQITFMVATSAGHDSTENSDGHTRCLGNPLPKTLSQTKGLALGSMPITHNTECSSYIRSYIFQRQDLEFWPHSLFHISTQSGACTWETEESQLCELLHPLHFHPTKTSPQLCMITAPWRM